MILFPYLVQFGQIQNKFISYLMKCQIKSIEFDFVFILLKFEINSLKFTASLKCVQIDSETIKLLQCWQKSTRPIHLYWRTTQFCSQAPTFTNTHRVCDMLSTTLNLSTTCSQHVQSNGSSVIFVKPLLIVLILFSKPFKTDSEQCTDKWQIVTD